VRTWIHITRLLTFLEWYTREICEGSVCICRTAHGATFVEICKGSVCICRTAHGATFVEICEGLYMSHGARCYFCRNR
jgi:hypothetical protein